MHIADPAGLPDSPSFPNRPILAAAGLGAGLALGVVLAVFLEFSDKSIRTEKDAAAVMDLPLLISVPWVVRTRKKFPPMATAPQFWGRAASERRRDDRLVRM